MNRFLLQLSGFFLFIYCFSGCKKAHELSYQVEAAPATYLNVAYGADNLQKMDVYLPPNRTSNTSIIIFVHGGSFIGGDKDQFSLHAQYLAACGYAVLNVNYRLVDGAGLFDSPTKHLVSPVKIKDQVADIGSVVDFAIAHASSWVTSDKRIGIVGHSAGGTLGLLYTYSPANAGKVQSVSNIAGALDMVVSDMPNWEVYARFIYEAGFRYTGYEFNLSNQKYYADVSPHYAANTAQKVPTLNVFPENNELFGLPNQGFDTYVKFTNRLNVLVVPNELFFVKGANHEFSRKGDWEVVLNKTVSFFNSNIK